MRLASTVLGLALISGCSLMILDDFSGGDGKSPDGGTAPLPGTDGGSTSSTSSSGASTSSSSTSSSSGDASNCAFCTNFEGTTLEQVATNTSIDPTGKLELDQGTLRARLAEHLEEGSFFVKMTREVSSPARRLTFDVDVFVDATPWGALNGSTIILSATIFGAQQRLACELYLARDGTIVATGPGTGLLLDDTSINLPRDRWVHVRLESDFSPGAGSFRLLYDGAVVASRSGIGFASVAGQTMNVNLGLGRTNAPTPALDVSYDNLAITLP